MLTDASTQKTVLWGSSAANVQDYVKDTIVVISFCKVARRENEQTKNSTVCFSGFENDQHAATPWLLTAEFAVPAEVE